MKTIKVKMLVYLLVALILIQAIVIGTTAYSVNKSSEKQTDTISTDVSKKYAQEMGELLNLNMKAATDLAATLKSFIISGNTDRDSMNELLKMIISENQDIIGVWCAFEPNAFDGKDAEYVNKAPYNDYTGRYIPYWNKVGGELNLNYCTSQYEDNESSTWYFQPRKTGKTYITEPYDIKVNGTVEKLVTLSVPIMINDKFIGAAGVDFSINKLIEINRSIVLYKTGYGILCSNSGTIIAHSNTELIGKNIGEVANNEKFTQAVERGESFKNISVSPIDHIEKMVVISPIKIMNSDQPWSLIATIPTKETNEESNKILIKMFWIALVGVLLITATIWFIADSISRPIKKLSNFNQKLANYDFTDTIEHKGKKLLKRKDEVGQIANSIQVMQLNLIKLFDGLGLAANNVSIAAENLSNSGYEISRSSDELANAINEIAKGAGEQASDTEKGAVKVVEIGEIIENSQRMIKQLDTAIRSVTDLKDEGMNIVNELINKSGESTAASKKIMDAFASTSASVSKIQNASAMIKNISEQTNLLSLNAAIEAARAGEQGKGFAVVATEVRKLAESSSIFTTEIEEVINELSISMQNTVDIVKSLDKQIMTQNESVTQTKNKFDGISNAIDETSKGMISVNEDSAAIFEKKDELINIITNLSAIAEENAASTQESAASVEEQSATLQHVAQDIETLKDLSNHMKQEISKFKI